MRLVVQRVKEAKVSLKEDGRLLGKIKDGYLVLVGVGREDTPAIAPVLAEKLLKLRVMSDATGKMNLALKEAGGELLVVSQFTLYADTEHGNRPSFIKAADSELAREIYTSFVKQLKDSGIKVETGEFGGYMEIEAKLDGPVTILYF